jgi:hypothetical protein
MTLTDAQTATMEALYTTTGYSEKYKTLQGAINQQQAVLELVQNAKDKVLGARDDLKYSVTTFSKQIEDIQNQINMTQSQQRLAVSSGGWFNWILNLLLVIALTTIISMTVRKFFFKQTAAQGYGGPRSA